MKPTSAISTSAFANLASGDSSGANAAPLIPVWVSGLFWSCDNVLMQPLMLHAVLRAYRLANYASANLLDDAAILAQMFC